MNLILETTGGSRLRSVGKHGGKTREFGYDMLILVVICTAMTRSTHELPVGSKRYAVLATSAQITSGWQQRVSTSQ